MFTIRGPPKEQLKNKGDNGFLPLGSSVRTWVPHTWLWKEDHKLEATEGIENDKKWPQMETEQNMNT